MTLRWAIRSLGETAWTVEAGIESAGVKRLAAGYVPGNDLFVITTLTNYSSRPSLIVLDTSGQLLGTHEVPDVTAFDIGGPACFDDGAVSRCVVPYSTNSFAGPKLGWLDIEFNDAEPLVLDDTHGLIDATGKLGLASHPDVAVFRGVAGTQRYELDQLEGIGAVALRRRIRSGRSRRSTAMVLACPPPSTPSR